MSLSEQDVAGIAEYARIALNSDELAEMTQYMNNAIDLLEPILHYNLDEVEPTARPEGTLVNVMRDDAIDPDKRGLTIDEALANAGSQVERYFRVPSILGAEGGDR